LNTPKKPGTDLAALKARLAKKSKDGDEAAAPAAAEAPPADQAPPPADFGAPAQQHYEPESQAYEPPAAPAFAPAEVQRAAAVAPPVAAPSFNAPSDDPFGGPSNATYDSGPDVGGEVPGRSNVGVIAFAGIIFLGIGLGVGWLGHKIVSGGEKLEAAKAKGKEMLAEVNEVANARKDVAVKLETEVGKLVLEDPAAGSAAIVALLQESFAKFPRIENLYGWQLAGIHKTGIAKTFELYEKSNRVKIELAALAGFLAENADALKASGGPVSFGVKFTADGAQLVALTGALCGESAADLAALKPCEDPSKAVAFKVQESIGAEEKTLVRGTGADQAVFLAPSGQIYNYAIGLEPAKNAAKVRDFMWKRVKESVDELATTEATVIKAMSNYSDNPDVDGSNPQPEP